MKKINAYELSLKFGTIIEEMEETAKKIEKLDSLGSFAVLTTDKNIMKIQKNRLMRIEHDYSEIKNVLRNAGLLESALAMNNAIKNLENNEKDLDAGKISERQAQCLSDKYDEIYHSVKRKIENTEFYVDLNYSIDNK